MLLESMQMKENRAFMFLPLSIYIVVSVYIECTLFWLATSSQFAEKRERMKQKQFTPILRSIYYWHKLLHTLRIH